MSYQVQQTTANGGALSTGGLTAGAAVATIAAASLPAGTYSVVVSTVLVGTAATADVANMGLYNGATLLAKLVPGITSTFQVLMSGSNSLSVNVINAATASTATYAATISATLIASS